MAEGLRRRYGRAFKLEAVRRMDAGESVASLAQELMTDPANLYRWHAVVRRSGGSALRDGAGRPSFLEALAGALEGDAAVPMGDLEKAGRQIAELERKVGQQQVDLDFFRGALRHIEASRRPSNGPGATASSPRSRR